MRRVTFILLFGFWLNCFAFAQDSPTYAPERKAPDKILKPFLFLPFSQKRMPEIKISETDKYSDFENRVHGHIWHYGTDLDATNGEKLYAPCKGWAVQGFHTALARSNDGKPVLYQGMTIGFGLGHFVQIFCKQSGVYVMLAHMREVSEKIPMVKVEQNQTTFEFNPIGIYQQYPDKNYAKKVNVGDFIGRVGVSGLGSDVFEDPWNETIFSWDSYHVHLEVYERTEKGTKNPDRRWDSFGWYTQVNKAPYNELKQSPFGLWVTDKKGRIKYAQKDW